jgi:L-fuculose-phosphate aldolase
MTNAISAAQMQVFRTTLMQASRILYAVGVMEGPTGHISVRVPGADQMIIKPVMIGFEEITEDEFILMEFTGERLEGGGKVGQVPAEYHIHSEIYKARPDVQSVIHTHPPYTVALSASGQTPIAYSFDGGQFTDGVPLFDETTDAITSVQLGERMVRVMGDKAAVVLKNHGVAVAGPSIQETTLRNVRLERTAWMHILAHQAGSTPAPLPPRGAGGGLGEGRQASRAQPTWDYHVRRAERLIARRG